jgi:hypothetical protein
MRSLATYWLSPDETLDSGRTGSLVEYRARNGRTCVEVVMIVDGATDHNPLSCESNLDCETLCFSVADTDGPSSHTASHLVGGLTRADADAVRITTSEGAVRQLEIGPTSNEIGARVFLAMATSFPRRVEVLHGDDVLASWGLPS